MNNHSLMLEPPENLCDDIISWGFDEIPQDYLYGESSRETNIHTTIINGIESKFEQIYKIICNYKSFDCNLGKLSFFSAANFDVLFIKIHSNDLYKLNSHLKNSIKYINIYSDFIPHITIAYLKKGFGSKYSEDLYFDKEKFSVEEIYFNSKFGVKTSIKLEK